MTEKKDVPEPIRPYVYHGVDLNWNDSGREAIGDCIFCGAEGKFSVNIDTSMGSCLRCNIGPNGKSGFNSTQFIQLLHEASDKATSDYSSLLKTRKGISQETLVHWEVCQSISTQHWLVPAYNHENRNLNQLYRYSKMKPGKYTLLPTPTFKSKIFGLNLWVASKPKVFICEGPWDTMALWEALRFHRFEGSTIVPASENESLLAEINVIGIPGCHQFNPKWTTLLKEKEVTLIFDNDHPRQPEKGGQVVQPGHKGLLRTLGILRSCKEKPSISVMNWGDLGFSEKFEDGFDVRDMLIRE